MDRALTTANGTGRAADGFAARLLAQAVMLNSAIGQPGALSLLDKIDVDRLPAIYQPYWRSATRARRETGLVSPETMIPRITPAELITIGGIEEFRILQHDEVVSDALAEKGIAPFLAIYSGPASDRSGRELRILSDVDLESQPKPDQLVEGVILTGALAGVFGPPGIGKSFTLVDLLGHIALGRPWHGHITQKRLCVYLALERRAGLAARLRAWKHYHGVEGLLGIYFPDAVGLFEARDVDRLLKAFEVLPEPPGAIVVDSYARAILPGDENGTRDTGTFLQNIDRVIAATNATVIPAHHTNAGGERERGSTALRAAADTMIQVKPEDGYFRLVCDKASELEPFAPIGARIVPHLESAVVVPADNYCMQYLGAALTEKQQETLRSFTLVCSNETAAASAWQKASGVAERTFYLCKKALEEKGYIRADGRRWRMTDLGRRSLEGAKLQ